MQSTTFRAMGTDVVILTPNLDDASVLAVERAQEEIYRLEALLTRFDPSSALSTLNQHPGRWMDVAPELCEVLALARQAFEMTHGLFNPCVGPVLEQLGYDVSFEQIGMRDTGKPVFLIPYLAQMHCPFDVRTEEGKVYLEPGNKIDLGGIGKGWIIKQVSGVLDEHRIDQFLCNAGGDLICRGANEDLPWTVGITDPFDSGKHIMVINVRDLAVATSGTYRRQWTRNGEKVHHLIDPFLGIPVQSDIVSCTVVHSDLIHAEIQAKVAILLGSEAAISWLDSNSEAWIIVKQSGEVVHSCNL